MYILMPITFEDGDAIITRVFHEEITAKVAQKILENDGIKTGLHQIYDKNHMGAPENYAGMDE